LRGVVFLSPFEESIGGSLTALLLLMGIPEPNDLGFELADSILDLGQSKQREILPDFMLRLFLRKAFIIKHRRVSRHWRSGLLHAPNPDSIRAPSQFGIESYSLRAAPGKAAPTGRRICMPQRIEKQEM